MGPSLRIRSSRTPKHHTGPTDVPLLTADKEKTGQALPVVQDCDASARGKTTPSPVSPGQTLDAWVPKRHEGACAHDTSPLGLCAAMAGSPHAALTAERERERERLLGCRKLSLVVDLDNTIVHTIVVRTDDERMARMQDHNHGSTTFTGVADPDARPELSDVFLIDLEQGGQRPNGERKHGNGDLHRVKPRPGLRAFLQTISEKYEPTVYTMGTRGYAEKVCAAVDGDERVFGGRIFSRDENEGNSTKSLSRLFPPCDKSMTAIIDDSRKVWEDKKNIVSVQPYVFFGDCDSPCPRRQHAGTPCHDSDDRELARLQHILFEVHKRFFEAYDSQRPRAGQPATPTLSPDVPSIIAEIRNETFAGMCFRFEVNSECPDKSMSIAKKYGARCGPLSGPVTHIILDGTRTEHELATRTRYKPHIVRYDWFSRSVGDWRAQDVGPYLVDLSPSDKGGLTCGGSPCRDERTEDIAQKEGIHEREEQLGFQGPLFGGTETPQ